MGEKITHPKESAMDATHWCFDIDQESPEVDVVEVMAHLEGSDSSEFPALYTTIDDLIRQLFSDPPAPEAQARLEFTYEGYRIVLHQDGYATFMKIV